MVSPWAVSPLPLLAPLLLAQVRLVDGMIARINYIVQLSCVLKVKPGAVTSLLALKVKGQGQIRSLLFDL